MHGIACPFMLKALRLLHLEGVDPAVTVHCVKEQVEPDPEFPTVKFPNPEEGEGALVCIAHI
jgi:phosphomannomutase